MKKTSLFTALAISLVSVSADARPTALVYVKHRCARPGTNEISDHGVCAPTPPAPNDDNTCTPYCGANPQWCTDCKGANGGRPLDQDGRPTVVAELLDEGFSCLLYSPDGDTYVGDCEVYIWACIHGQCTDSDGHKWRSEDVPDPDCVGLLTSDSDALVCGDGFSLCIHNVCKWIENPGCSYGNGDPIECITDAVASYMEAL
jgi:hypothetical protein